MASKPAAGAVTTEAVAVGISGASVSQSAQPAAGRNESVQSGTEANAAPKAPEVPETQTQQPKAGTVREDLSIPPKGRKAAYSAPSPEELSKKFKTWN
jgi:hypothetical protein